MKEVFSSTTGLEFTKEANTNWWHFMLPDFDGRSLYMTVLAYDEKTLEYVAKSLEALRK